jgi:hypothetical protein
MLHEQLLRSHGSPDDQRLFEILVASFLRDRMCLQPFEPLSKAFNPGELLVEIKPCRPFSAEDRRKIDDCAA